MADSLAPAWLRFSSLADVPGDSHPLDTQVEHNKRHAPTQLFLFFERLSPRALSWASSQPSLGCLVLPAPALAPLARIARADLLWGGAYLVDLSGAELPNGRGVLAFQVLYSWGLRGRLLVCSSARAPQRSVDSVFSSAGWLEREFSEMFGCPLEGKADSRNLLLDYSLAEAPLRKSFPCSGRSEVSYSALAGGLISSPAAPVDL